MVSLVIFLLLAFSFWAVRSRNAAGALEIRDVALCDQVDEKMRPLGKGTVFAYGTRQLCLWFGYSQANGGDRVQVRWFYRGRPIHSEHLRVDSGNGFKALYLLQEDGSPLPKGLYSVRISLFDKIFSDVAFEISE